MKDYRSHMSMNNKSGGIALNHIADTKFSAKESRWSHLTKNVPGMDHKWSTMMITPVEKASDELFMETKAMIARRGIYHNVSPSSCGNGFPRYETKYALQCSGLKFGSDGLSITQTRAQQDDPLPCTGLLAHPHNEAVFNCEVHGTLDTTKFCLSGCSNLCRVCKGCAQTIQRSKTIEGASSAPLTKVQCVCGEETKLVTLETNMLEKSFDSKDFARILPSPPSANRSMLRASSRMSQSSATNTIFDSRSSVIMYGLPEVDEEQAAEFMNR